MEVDLTWPSKNGSGQQKWRWAAKMEVDSKPKVDSKNEGGHQK